MQDNPAPTKGAQLNGWILALPALILSWPLWPMSYHHGLLASSLRPEVAATSIVVFACVPVLLLAAWRNSKRSGVVQITAGSTDSDRRSRWMHWSLLACVACVAVRSTGNGSDSFESQRALLAALLMLAAFVSASSLAGASNARSESPDHRGKLRRPVAAVLALAIEWVALVQASAGAMIGQLPHGHGSEHGHGHWGGLLQNSGVSAALIVPGALVALLSCAQRGRGWRGILDWATVFMTAFYFACAPVHSGILAVSAVGMVALFLRATIDWNKPPTQDPKLVQGKQGPKQPSRFDASLRLFAALMFFILNAIVLFWFNPERIATEDNGHAQAALETESGGPGSSSSSSSGLSTGGFAVRTALYPRVLRMIGEHPLGVGVGQFSAAFPPYRDPQEIELSTYGRTLWQETQVEHAHNDLLHFTAESGWLAGACLLVLLVLGARRALGSLARKTTGTEQDENFAGTDHPTALAGLSSAFLGLLILGFARVPLTVDAGSIWIGFAILGVLSVEGGSFNRPASKQAQPGQQEQPQQRSSSRLQLALPLLTGVLILVAWKPALTFLQGQSRLATSVGHSARPDSNSNDRVGLLAAENALRARPNDVQALGQWSRLQAIKARAAHNNAGRNTGQEPDYALTLSGWDKLLTLRPHHLEALIQRGLYRLLSGERELAHEDWERAIQLDPAHPNVLQNLARLECERGSEAAYEYLTRYTERDFERALLLFADLASEASAWGHREMGLRLAKAAEFSMGPEQKGRRPESATSDTDLEFEGNELPQAWLVPEMALGRYTALKDNEPASKQAQGWKCSAHLGFAEQQAQAEQWPQVARSLRQAKAASLEVLNGRHSPLISMQLAAAELLSKGGEAEANEAKAKAAASLEGIRRFPQDLLLLPEWAGQALLEAGLLTSE